MSTISACRICRSPALVEVLDLGTSALTGVFPASADEVVPSGRLLLLLCEGCGLVQLADSFPPEQMYGDNYGYRSGLNASMVEHLARTVRRLERLAQTKPGDVILDIGANDSTLLRSYQTPDLIRVGIDPTIRKFRDYYPADIIAVEDFFSARAFQQACDRPADLVTSIAMFYDLEDPVAFAADIRDVLADDGLWHFEQSYMPWMLRSGAYDTICHEHLEYYSLTTIDRILQMVGMRIVDVATNAVNGGSISVTAAKESSSRATDRVLVDWFLAQERRGRIADLQTWQGFAATVRDRQEGLLELLTSLKASGRSVEGLGASTKGNVVLQTTGIGADLVSRIGDVNPYKFGRFMPGTGIPIVSEDEVLASRPDFLLILPWHFRETFMTRLDRYLAEGGHLILPLPDIEILGY